jgi:hypothetical protein
MLFQLHHTFLYLLSIQLVSDAIHENYAPCAFLIQYLYVYIITPGVI